MFKKEKTVIFGVPDPKSVRFEHVPIPFFFWGDIKILATWGGNRENFEKSNPQITDSPLGNCISGLKIVKIFACGALMIPHQFPQIFACGAAKKLTFGGYFDRFSIFISPPFWRGMGGKFLFPPHFRGVWGGN